MSSLSLRSKVEGHSDWHHHQGFLSHLWLGLLSKDTVLLAGLATVCWNSVLPLNRNRDPIRKKFCLAFGPLTGALSLKIIKFLGGMCHQQQQKHLKTLSKESYLKNEWCSTEHFHRCLQAFSFRSRNTKVCSWKSLFIDCICICICIYVLFVFVFVFYLYLYLFTHNGHC